MFVVLFAFYLGVFIFLVCFNLSVPIIQRDKVIISIVLISVVKSIHIAASFLGMHLMADVP